MKKLIIVQMNDSHAYLNLHPELFWENGHAAYRYAGGYARVAAVLQQIRAETPDQVLFLDGGDTFHGTYPAVQSRGAALVPILNALKPAAMTAHWEFAYTPQGVKHLAGQLDYPILAANIYQEPTAPAGSQLFLPPYKVIEMAGLRIGVVGIASNIVDKSMPPEFSEGLTFTNGRQELPGLIQKLREEEKVQLVILLSHLGFPQDMELLRQVPGVDVALSAHTHHRLEHAVQQGSALVVQSGSHGSFLTRLDLEIEEDGRIHNFRHRWIVVGEGIDPDPEVEALVREAGAPYREELQQVVGSTRLPLDRGLNLETTADNFLLSALLQHTGAEIAFSNGWRYGAPILPGPIRLDDLYNLAPMNPPISTVELSGKEIRTMLEKNLEHTFSRDPFQQMGGYVKRCLGLRALIKIENPPGERIQKLFAGHTEVRPDARYQAAFITEQGVPAQFGQNRQQHPEKLIPVLQEYLKNNPPLTMGLAGTFTVI